MFINLLQVFVLLLIREVVPESGGIQLFIKFPRKGIALTLGQEHIKKHLEILLLTLLQLTHIGVVPVVVYVAFGLQFAVTQIALRAFPVSLA